METEKIYCCEPRDNDNALAAAILATNNRRDYGYDANAWMNNPFAYLMFLAFTRNGFGFGGDGYGYGHNVAATQGIEVQSQLDAIRTQLNNNQNSGLIMDAIKGNAFAISQLAQNLNVDFNDLQKCCCDVRAAIREVGGKVDFSAERVINAVNMGDCRIIEALKDCCCQTQRQIAEFKGEIQLQNCKDTAELRNGQRDLGVALANGFAQTAYATQDQTCKILQAGQANTQRIIDTLNDHWKDEQAREIQDLKGKISNMEQTNIFAKMLRDRDNGCGCGTNYCTGF